MRKTTSLAIAASRKKKEIKMNPMILEALFLTAAIAPASASNTEDAHMYCIEAQDGATNIAEATNGPEVWPLWSAFSKEQCQQIAAGIMPDGLVAELVQRTKQNEAELRAEDLNDQAWSKSLESIAAEQAIRQEKADADAKATEVANAACKTDAYNEDGWKKCADNSGVAATMAGIHARTECKMAAARQAKYGDPEWPGFPAYSFNIHSGGKSALATGKMFFFEKDARFQNMFGAMEHVVVTCEYNFNDKTAVVNVDATQ
jgi:hypothetical protein